MSNALQDAEALYELLGKSENYVTVKDVLKGAIDEIKRLRVLEANMKRRDDDIDDLLANCNQLRERCWKTESELARWQQIAIDERARIILDAEDKFERAKIHHCPNTSESCQDDCDLSWCPSAEFWRSVATKELGQAAKELDLEQEASYVTRLEEKILDFYECDATRRGCCRQVAQDQARAALVRIREGKE